MCCRNVSNSSVHSLTLMWSAVITFKLGFSHFNWLRSIFLNFNLQFLITLRHNFNIYLQKTHKNTLQCHNSFLKLIFSTLLVRFTKKKKSHRSGKSHVHSSHQDTSCQVSKTWRQMTWISETWLGSNAKLWCGIMSGLYRSPLFAKCPAEKLMVHKPVSF